MIRMTDRLDHCEIHGNGPCDCPAYLVAMGCMDLWIEQQLELDPRLGAILIGKLRSVDAVEKP